MKTHKVTVLKKGDKYVGHCPFHDGKTPSLVVETSGAFHCLSCGTSGDGADIATHSFPPLPSFCIADIPIKNAKKGDFSSVEMHIKMSAEHKTPSEIQVFMEYYLETFVEIMNCDNHEVAHSIVSQLSVNLLKLGGHLEEE